MRYAVTMAFLAIILGPISPATAQNKARMALTPNKPAQLSSLDQRYMECMDGTECHTRDRLQIMQDMNNEIRKTMNQMSQACMNMNYIDCMEPQRSERQQWHKMHSHMHDMMKTMETKDSITMIKKQEPAEQSDAEEMSQTEPSAGNQKEEKKTWWRNIFDEAEEPYPKND